jgi:GSH-dependent disulfide-bond oxidoreductase
MRKWVAILEPLGVPLAYFESGAISIYLAEETDRLSCIGPAPHHEILQSLMFQVGGIGSMVGQLGFFHNFAGKDFKDKRPCDRCAAESLRLPGVFKPVLLADESR